MELIQRFEKFEYCHFETWWRSVTIKKNRMLPNDLLAPKISFCLNHNSKIVDFIQNPHLGRYAQHRRPWPSRHDRAILPPEAHRWNTRGPLKLELEQAELEMRYCLNKFWPHTLYKRVGDCIRACSETHRYLVFELAEILDGLPTLCTQSRANSSGAPH